MRSIPPEDLGERTFRFACDFYDYCVDLVRVGGLARRVAYQLFGAAGSIGSNREEATAAYSRKRLHGEKLNLTPRVSRSEILAAARKREAIRSS